MGNTVAIWGEIHVPPYAEYTHPSPQVSSHFHIRVSLKVQEFIVYARYRHRQASSHVSPTQAQLLEHYFSQSEGQ